MRTVKSKGYKIKVLASPLFDELVERWNNEDLDNPSEQAKKSTGFKLLQAVLK